MDTSKRNCWSVKYFFGGEVKWSGGERHFILWWRWATLHLVMEASLQPPPEDKQSPSQQHDGTTSSFSPDSKVHEAYMGPIWGREDPGGPHVDPMNLAIGAPSHGDLCHWSVIYCSGQSDTSCTSDKTLSKPMMAQFGDVYMRYKGDELTQCGLATPYDDRDLGQHWLR